MFKNYTSSHCIPWLGFDKFRKILYSLELDVGWEENDGTAQRVSGSKFVLCKCTPFLWETIVDCKIIRLDKDVRLAGFSCSISQCSRFIGTILFDNRDSNDDRHWIIDVETGNVEKSIVKRKVANSETMKAMLVDDKRLLLHSVTFDWIVVHAEKTFNLWEMQYPMKNLVIYQIMATEQKNLFHWRKITMSKKNQYYRSILCIGNEIYCFQNYLTGWDVYNLATGVWSEVKCKSSLPEPFRFDWTVVLMNEDFYVVKNYCDDIAAPVLKLDNIQRKFEPTKMQFQIATWTSCQERLCLWTAAGSDGLIVTPAVKGSLEEEWFGYITRVNLASLQDIAFQRVMQLCPVSFGDLDFINQVGVPEPIVRIYFGPAWTRTGRKIIE